MNSSDDILQNSLDQLEAFLNEHSYEEIQALFAEINQMEFDGPTLSEYLNSFETVYSTLVDHEVLVSSQDSIIKVRTNRIKPSFGKSIELFEATSLNSTMASAA